MDTPTTDLSFDPRDPYFPTPGEDVTWALQVFTTENGYGLATRDLEVAEEPGAVRVHGTRYAALGGQRAAGEGRVDVHVARTAAGVVTWDVQVTHDEPVKAVKLIVRGLCEDCLVGGWWSPTSRTGSVDGADGQRFKWNYPGPDWATPWAAAQGNGHGTTLSVVDDVVRPKCLHVHRPWYREDTAVEVILVQRAGARTGEFHAPIIRLRHRISPETVQEDLDQHIDLVAAQYGLQAWELRRDVPAWLRTTELVVTLHGQHWTGYVFNSFADMRTILDEVSHNIDPARVLAYLPGWEGRYYYDYPRYRPAPDLGGPAGFADLCEHARQLGIRLMPMLGANGANVRRYPAWMDAVILNDTSRYPELLNRPDWDGDRYGEGDQVFLNVGEPAFRQHIVTSVCNLAAEYGIDAVFFDTAGFYWNDPRFDMYDGYRALVSDIAAQQPHLLLAAEGWWDALLALFPLSQQWLGYDRDIRAPRLLTRFGRTTGHLAEGTPGRGSTGVHEAGSLARSPDRRLAGHIPVLSFVGDTISTSHAAVREICRWAGRERAVGLAAASQPCNVVALGP